MYVKLYRRFLFLLAMLSAATFASAQTANITFLDASVRWLLSKRIDLALAATNLLDETDYRYTSFGSLSESFYSFNIRPRNIIIKMQIKI